MVHQAIRSSIKTAGEDIISSWLAQSFYSLGKSVTRRLFGDQKLFLCLNIFHCCANENFHRHKFSWLAMRFNSLVMWATRRPGAFHFFWRDKKNMKINSHIIPGKCILKNCLDLRKKLFICLNILLSGQMKTFMGTDLF